MYPFIFLTIFIRYLVLLWCVDDCSRQLLVNLIMFPSLFKTYLVCLNFRNVRYLKMTRDSCQYHARIMICVEDLDQGLDDLNCQICYLLILKMARGQSESSAISQLRKVVKILILQMRNYYQLVLAFPFLLFLFLLSSSHFSCCILIYDYFWGG